MALTNTITVAQIPFEKYNRVSAGWEILQTTGSGATTGVLKVFDAATASDDFKLISLIVSPTNPTATSYATIYMGTDAIAVLPTASTTPVFMNFAPFGLTGGTTTTATVSIVITTATQTCAFTAIGLRKK